MITVVDLGVGNIGSVLKALKCVGAEINLTNKASDIERASKIVLPGVSTFESGMIGVKKYNLIEPLRSAALKKHIPFLGFCMGMQILASEGFENGQFEGLGIIPGAKVRQLDPKLCPVIPHMGWNNLESIAGNPLLRGLNEKPDFYFVHSYHMTDIPAGVTVNVVNYGENITAAVSFKNIFGTQFHPEKSQANGLKILRNFLEYA